MGRNGPPPIDRKPMAGPNPLPPPKKKNDAKSRLIAEPKKSDTDIMGAIMTVVLLGILG